VHNKQPPFHIAQSLLHILIFVLLRPLRLQQWAGFYSSEWAGFYSSCWACASACASACAFAFAFGGVGIG
jgi:hypothetical protein